MEPGPSDSSCLENYDDAISDSEEAIKIRYGYLFGRVMRTASLVERGNVEDAREETAGRSWRSIPSSHRRDWRDMRTLSGMA